MSSETIVNALFLISAVMAAGILISAIFPVIYRTSDTFGSASYEADLRMRTDFSIVNCYAKSPDAQIWLKNTGTTRIASGDLERADVFIGAEGDFERLPLSGHYTILNQIPANDFWDQGETLFITVQSDKIPPRGGLTYFALVLPNGVAHSEIFTAY